MSESRTFEREAQRLVRCYPKGWRARYGDEFTQLLIDELTDGDVSLTRKLDVLAHGVWTRLTYAGLAGSVLDSQRRMRSMIGALLVVSAVFVMLAVGVWAQLAVGWQWSAPAGAGTTAAMWLMSAGLFGLGALVVLVIALSAMLLVGAARRGRVDRWRPVIVSLAAGAVLYLGCRHFGPHWPGTGGGHAWSDSGLVPGWVARLGWAGTLWISSYWAHPVALGSFPTSELAWMVISPAAWVALIVSGAVTVRRLELTAKLQRLAVLLCVVAVTGMVVFLAGAVLWLYSDSGGPGSLFAVGAIDFAIVAMLVAGLIATTHLLGRVAASLSTIAH
jgi:hypothetical protein